MFEIFSFNYAEGNFDSWILPYDYHVVYILENGKDAYIGETTDIIRRSGEHKKDPKIQKYKFQRIHVITSKIAHATEAHHFENLLVVLMRLDHKFHIINDEKGYQWNQYYNKNDYELYFDQLWFLLEQKGLVKEKKFQSIMNMSAYKYLPSIELNEEQKRTLTSIIHVLDSGELDGRKKNYKERPILISGRAGTGKTLVAIHLFYYLRNDERYKNKKIALAISRPPMRKVVQSVFKEIKGLHVKDVISPAQCGENIYDIIICDEAHKLRRNKNQYRYSRNFLKVNEKLGLDQNHDELDWILKRSKYQILFYDSKQLVTPSEIPNDCFFERLKERYRGIRPIELKKQMRMEAGDDYVSYIYDILYQNAEKKIVFPYYDLKIFSSFSDMKKSIDEKYAKYGLSHIVSGYGFEWKNDQTEKAYDIFIDGVKTRWNRLRKEGWVGTHEAREEVGSIYTVSGLDLNYIGVVISPELYFDKKDGKIKIDKDHYFDHSVKRGVKKDELKSYILNTYGVLLTRAIKGTYLYICDPGLREYFQEFIDCA